MPRVLNIARFPAERAGRLVIRFVASLGENLIFFLEILRWLFRRPFRPGIFLAQLDEIGVGSLFIVALTGTFTGMVLAIQSVYAFKVFNAEGLVGSAVALSLTRELSPVLTALMVSGRAGASIATELGTMRVTEQIDALSTMAVSPLHYLVVPRVVATTIMTPVLTMIFSAVGLAGGYFVAVEMLHVNPGTFFRKIQWYLSNEDVVSGLVKATVFGLVIGLVSSFRGFYARGGARGVGAATTQAVVLSSVSVLVLDYFLTAMMY